MVETIGRYSHQPHISEKLSRLLALPRIRRSKPQLKSYKRPVRLNEADQHRLVKAYARTRSVNKVGHEFGIRRQTVAAILERHGIKRRYKIMSAKSIAVAKRLYESGKSLVDVGDELNVDPKTVRKALLYGGAKLRPVGTNQWSPRT